jgi:thioredoxin 1
LEKNPGLVIIKMGATWCGPCKKIKPVVDAFFASSPDNVICCEIDVDESMDLYSYFKSKRMVNGIPVIMCFKKGNTSYIPDDSITGSDPGDLDAFFKRCGLHLLSIRGK